MVEVPWTMLINIADEIFCVQFQEWECLEFDEIFTEVSLSRWLMVSFPGFDNGLPQIFFIGSHLQDHWCQLKWCMYEVTA